MIRNLTFLCTLFVCFGIPAHSTSPIAFFTLKQQKPENSARSSDTWGKHEDIAGTEVPAPSNTAFPGWRGSFEALLTPSTPGISTGFSVPGTGTPGRHQKRGSHSAGPMTGITSCQHPKPVKFPIIPLYLKTERKLCCRGLLYNLIPLGTA